jgi:hypothetical protein
MVKMLVPKGDGKVEEDNLICLPTLTMICKKCTAQYAADNNLAPRLDSFISFGRFF